MALWDKTGSLPKNLNREQKRNVVATDVGFVRKISYTAADGSARKQNEMLVPVRGVANSTNFGAPTIVDVWHSVDTAVINTPIQTFVSYDEPLTIGGGVKLNVANTAGGSAKVATSPATLINAENTLAFTWTPTVAGLYKVQAQTMANSSATAINLLSSNAGTEVAPLIITGPVSNTAGMVIVTAS